MTRVRDLEAGLIDRADFARRQWFSASPRWYYHRPGRPRPQRLRAGFYELIDPSLREPCLMLHKAGLGTLPSCEGHFHERRYFQEVWETLCREEAAIRKGGLLVEDSESNEQVLFQNADYALPWRNFAEFHDDLTRTQPGGYLGVELQGQHRHIARELNRYRYQEAEASIALERPRPGFWIAAAYVDPATPESGQKAWRRVATYFRHLLHMPMRRLAISAPQLGSRVHC